MTEGFLAAHRQADARLRLEWGPTGAAAVAAGVDIAVVVDVLSFTTTLGIALERGTTVLPFRWKDERAEEYAAAHDAVLAVGRLESRSLAATGPGAGPVVTLSPAAMTRVSGVPRLVLPSPNGSTICALLAGSGSTVVAASLRNAAAVSAWLAPRLAEGATVAVVPAGERWPDGSLRPAVEDLWGAGAVLSGVPLDDASVEARLAVAAWRAVAERVADELAACAGGRELAEAGFADDVAVSAEVDAGSVVPVLVDGEFRPA